jgi:hypothetical protein
MIKTQIFYRLILSLHLIGMVVMAGTTLIDYFTFKTFCKLTDQGDNRALGLLPMMSKYGSLVRTGAGIIILTGIAMLLLSKGLWQQPWFKIKMVLVICLVLNGLFAGKKQGLKFRSLLNENGSHVLQDTSAIKANLHFFYLLQLSLFFIIILVSMVKINRSGM